jgi:hypothetical protein
MIGNFLIWLSGADPIALSYSGIDEQRKYKKLGLAIMIPAIMSWVGMWYCGPLIGLDGLSLFLAATMWSLIILTVDTYLVSSFPTEKVKDRSYYRLAIFRLLLAGFIGYAISHPLILKIFESNITEKIENQHTARIESLIHESDSILLMRNQLLELRRSNLDTLIHCKQALRSAEAAGTKKEFPCGNSSGIPGNAIRHKLIEKEIDSLDIQRKNVGFEIEQNRDKTQSELTFRMNSAIEFKSSDYLSRVQALHKIKHDETVQYGWAGSSTRWTTLFLAILFILLDSMAVLAKILTKYGEYDDKKHQMSIVHSNVSATAIDAKTKLEEDILKMDVTYRAVVAEEVYLDARRNGLSPMDAWDKVRPIIEDLSWLDVGPHRSGRRPQGQRGHNRLRSAITVVVLALGGGVLWWTLRTFGFDSEWVTMILALYLFVSSSIGIEKFKS